MKLIHIIPILLLLTGTCSVKETDPKDILKKSRAACQAVQSGYYEMTQWKKYMSEKDTSLTSFHCTFKKIKNDTIFPFAFHYKIKDDGKNMSEILYSGQEFVMAHRYDSMASIMSKEKWAADIVSIRHNFEFYEPILRGKLYPVRKETDFNDSSYTIRLIGDEKVGAAPVYHIQIDEAPQKAQGMDCFLNEYHYWIRKSDFIPVQYSSAYCMVMEKDTMYQYEKVRLDRFDSNITVDEHEFEASSIASFYKVKDYTPFEEPLPLPIDTVAPAWELPALNDKKVSLNSLKSKLVLVDFFYKSCYPCMLALPILQALSEKYKGKGLEIVGIDPNDKKEDGIADFLSRRGVTYTVLLDGAETAKRYRVQGYPTMFLVSRTGKIIFTDAGYGPGTEKMLEELIQKNL